MAVQEDKSEIRIFCPLHKKDFWTSASTRILCGHGLHSLPEGFPFEGLWEYCCDCQRFSPSEIATKGAVGDRCIVCGRQSVRRYMCHACRTLTFDSDEPATNRAVKLSPEGALLGPCPGCLSAAGQPVANHLCGSLGVNFTTSLITCPFCRQQIRAPDDQQAIEPFITSDDKGEALQPTREKASNRASVHPSAKKVKASWPEGVPVFASGLTNSVTTRIALMSIGAVLTLSLLINLLHSSPASQSIGVALRAEKTTFQKGEPITLNALVNDAVGSLKYNWETSAGEIRTQASEATLDTTSLALPDQGLIINISVNVIDSRGISGRAGQTIKLLPGPQSGSVRSAKDEPGPTRNAPQQELSTQAGNDGEQRGEKQGSSKLVISSNIDGVAVSIDGGPPDALYRGGRTVLLPPGPHKLIATKPGYKRWERSVFISGDGRQRVSIEMVGEEPTPRERALEHLRRAEELTRNRQYDSAIGEIDHGLRIDPGNQLLLKKKNELERVKQILNRPNNISSVY